MVLAHKRVSMVEIELVSSRSRRNDRTGLRRKQIVLPQRHCNVAEMWLASTVLLSTVVDGRDRSEARGSTAVDSQAW